MISCLQIVTVFLFCNNLKNQISYEKENFVFTYMRWAMLVFLY